MNILIIGNGFDLAHGLPTKYKDFLDVLYFVKLLKRDSTNFNEFENKYLNNWDTYKNKDEDKGRKIIHKKLFKEMFEKKEYMLEKDGLPKNYKENLWLNYFLNIYEFKIQGEGWIDLETEISRVIQRIDYILKHNNENNNEGNNGINYIEVLFDDDLVKDITIESIFNEQGKKYSINILNKFIKILEKDLDIFIQCLDWYLNNYALNFNENKYSPDIKELPEINAILSFNYTDIYNFIYNKNKINIEYDYIHGKLSSYDRKNNIVFGIAEYLDNKIRDKDIRLIRFKKYFQRIHKKTGIKYKEWLTREESHNVYIFGHSLDESDKDILQDIILNKNVITTIFYLDDEAYAREITNMVKLIGQDNLNKKVYAANPTIKFMKQKDMKSGF